MITKPPFEQLVRRHGDTVLRVCCARLAPTDAEDAWAETFLSALRAYPDLADGANHEAWLVTIAHRKAIDAVRAGRRRPIPVAEFPVLAAGSSPDSGFELGPALDALPAKQRHAVAYHYLAGLRYAQVAEILGGSPDAARRAAADGIAALRRRFTLEGDPR